ncbi:hypothetical protein F4814DRAFT_218805 [Daldinia grandis]|nr:hypothetical protein F4814DRAFT_218805 [Daldinia grandis]
MNDFPSWMRMTLCRHALHSRRGERKEKKKKKTNQKTRRATPWLTPPSCRQPYHLILSLFFFLVWYVHLHDEIVPSRPPVRPLLRCQDFMYYVSGRLLHCPWHSLLPESQHPRKRRLTAKSRLLLSCGLRVCTVLGDTDITDSAYHHNLQQLDTTPDGKYSQITNHEPRTTNTKTGT